MSNFTNEQKAAISERRPGNLLLSAAAGAGKTTVLISRIIGKLTDEIFPIDADRILSVTFTNAAASEMREKITNKLSALAEQNPSDKNIRRQLMLIQKAQITTVHAFCASLLRQYFYLCGINADFRLGDSAELSLLRAEIMDDILEKEYDKEENEKFYELLDFFSSSRDDKKIAESVLDFYDKVTGVPFYADWIKAREKDFSSEIREIIDTVWGEILLSDTRKILESCLTDLKEAIFLVRDYPEAEKPYLSRFRAEARKIENAYLASLDEKITFDALRKAVSDISFERLGILRNAADIQEFEDAKILRTDVKKRIGTLISDYYFASNEENIEDLKILSRPLSKLFELVLRFDEEYSAKKREENILDFSDLEHLTLSILAKREENGNVFASETAKKISEKYSEIFVDEYQDTNEIQDLIFKLLSREEKNIFMVGDVKQSIYGFRRARPYIFAEKYRKYSDDLSSESGRKILLRENFRSREEIIDTVNLVFSQLMTDKFGDIEYGKEEYLIKGATFPDEGGASHQTEIVLSDLADEEEETEKARVEAKLVACKILTLFSEDFKVTDSKTGDLRPLKYRDIAVLSRSMRSKAKAYEEVFKEYGIPIYCDQPGNIFETVESITIFSLLKIIDNPFRDVPLIGAMRSVIFSFTNEEIAKIRLEDKDDYLYSLVLRQAKKGDEKCKEFVEKIEKYRELSKTLPVHMLLWTIYEDTSLLSLFGAMRNGEVRRENLKILYEYATEFEKTSRKGLFNFLNYIEEIVTSSGEMESAKILSESADVVRTMTIHKSKGLEFPVVILTSICDRFNASDRMPDIVFHEKYGVGAKIRDIKKGIKYPTLSEKTIKSVMKRESLAEEINILYVAQTRAKEKLIIVGAMTDPKSKMEKLLPFLKKKEEKLPFSYLSRCGNYFDFLIPCILRNQNTNFLFEEKEKFAIPRKESSYPIKFSILPAGTIGEIQNKKSKTLGNDIEEIIEDKKLTAYFKEIAEFIYPEREKQKLPSKLSVTELKGKTFDEELKEFVEKKEKEKLLYFPKPRFLKKEEEKITPAERGTFLHRAMQYIDLTTCDYEILLHEISKLYEKGLLPKDVLREEDIKKIYEFLLSDIGKRIKNAVKIFREEKFTLLLPVEKLSDNTEKIKENGNNILIQGVIDCFFEEKDGNFVLIDFKSDAVRGNFDDIIRKRYQKQIKLYEIALMEMYGKELKEKYIYLFQTNSLITIS